MSIVSDIATAPSLARRMFPGFATCLALAMAATFISDHYGGPTLLFALLFGMALHFLSKEGKAVEGIAFSARTVLRIGVALLGIRISAAQIIDLGVLPIVVVVAGVTSTIVFGRVAAAALGLNRAQGILTGGSVAICGASAALAISAVLPRGRDAERDTLFTIIAVTTLSTAAMILYPLVAKSLDLDHRAAGIFLGGTIHDVAQVVGAGYLISDETGIIATFVKLMRVATLVPAVLAIGWLFRGESGQTTSRGPVALPGFLLAFVALATANSLGLVPPEVASVLNDASRWCLVIAIAALGIKTSLQEMAAVGWRPILLVVAETLYLAAFVLAVLLFA